MASPFPHFFQIIVQRNLEDKKLMIPEKFVNLYGKFLSSSIYLKLPNGLEWQIGLTTAADGTVWLENGWHRFSERYGLKFGSFLVCRFDGQSTFHTILCDDTGLEIEYADDLKKESSSFPDRCEPKIEHEEEENPLPNVRVSRRRSRPSSKEDLSNLESEKTGFQVVMRKSFVERRFNMTIPKGFAKKYLNEQSGTIKIENSEGKSWTMVYKWNFSYQIDYAYISSGWKCFAKENHLKEGDILFFKMIKKDHFSFTVEQRSPSPSPSPPILPKNNVATANTRNPSFQVKIPNKSKSSNILNIPVAFASDHLSARMHSAKLVVGKKQWTVKMKHYEACTRFSAGLPRFYSQNSLKAGDSCLFELVNKTESDCVFKVKIVFQKPSISISD